MTASSDQYLTVDRVRATYARCYRPEGSQPLKNVTVEAWIMRHTFSVGVVQKNRESIIRMLLSLPAGFRADMGEGGSVLMMTQRGDGTQWASEMPDIEKLVALGIASGLMSFCVPREVWHRLPGELPYVRVEITKFGVSVN